MATERVGEGSAGAPGFEYQPTRRRLGLNPRIVFLRRGLEASYQGCRQEGHVAEAGRRCFPGLVAFEALQDERWPFPQEGTMACGVWSQGLLWEEVGLGGEG